MEKNQQSNGNRDREIFTLFVLVSGKCLSRHDTYINIPLISAQFEVSLGMRTSVSSSF